MWSDSISHFLLRRWRSINSHCFPAQTLGDQRNLKVNWLLIWITLRYCGGEKKTCPRVYKLGMPNSVNGSLYFISPRHFKGGNLQRKSKHLCAPASEGQLHGCAYWSKGAYRGSLMVTSSRVPECQRETSAHDCNSTLGCYFTMFLCSG